jgi:hypothetical protein
MKNEIIYTRICCVLFLIAILWGYVAPRLVSANYDILVTLGGVVFVATPVFAWWILKPIFKSESNNNLKKRKKR